MTVVEIAIGQGVPSAEADVVRQSATELLDLDHQPVSRARLTVRGVAAAAPLFVADATVLFGGRLIAAHTTGATAVEAARAARERLRRQVQHAADRERDRHRRMRRWEALPLALEHRPEAARKPAAARRIVHRHTYLDFPLSTAEAVRELLDIDAEFMLFVHARTQEDVVVHLRDIGEIGLLHPPGSELADERDIVVPETSRYPEPIELRAAREEMDFLEHRFLYFIDAADGRGKVIYLRHDGDYGLVEPA
jgi:hypothetical protein